MAVNPNALGMAAGLVAGAAFALCAAAVAAAPGATMAVLGWVLHLDLSTMARPLTLANFCGGIVLFSAFVWIVVASTAQLYNRFAGHSPKIA